MNLVEEALQDERCWTVYIHRNKLNNKRYVGITSQKNPKNRWNCGHGYRTQPFYNAIQKYGWNNFDNEIVCSNLTCDEANVFEITLIRELGTLLKNGNGYNTTEGGKGAKGINTDRSMYTGGDATNVRKVVCLNSMEVFDCIKDASEKYNVNPANISAVLHGKYKSCGKSESGEKLMWWYHDEDKTPDFYASIYESMVEKSKKHKAVGGSRHNAKKVININSGTVYDSISIAERASGSRVRNKLKNKSNKSEWAYYEDYIQNKLCYKVEEIKEEEKEKIKKTTGKRVICEGIVFHSAKECAEYYIENYSTMRTWLNGRSAMPIKWFEKGLRYEDTPIGFYEDRLRIKAVDKEVKLKPSKPRRIIECEGKRFDNLCSFEEYYSLKHNTARWLTNPNTKLPTMWVNKKLKIMIEGEAI